MTTTVRGRPTVPDGFTFTCPTERVDGDGGPPDSKQFRTTNATLVDTGGGRGIVSANIPCPHCGVVGHTTEVSDAVLGDGGA